MMGWWARYIVLAFGDEMATVQAEVHQNAITGYSEDLAQEFLLRGCVMGFGGHPKAA
jgi:hypothetical protein